MLASKINEGFGLKKVSQRRGERNTMIYPVQIFFTDRILQKHSTDLIMENGRKSIRESIHEKGFRGKYADHCIIKTDETDIAPKQTRMKMMTYKTMW